VILSRGEKEALSEVAAGDFSKVKAILVIQCLISLGFQIHCMWLGKLCLCVPDRYVTLRSY